MIRKTDIFEQLDSEKIVGNRVAAEKLAETIKAAREMLEKIEFKVYCDKQAEEEKE